jgi:hypothetical protein
LAGRQKIPVRKEICCVKLLSIITGVRGVKDNIIADIIFFNGDAFNSSYLLFHNAKEIMNYEL